MEKKSFDEVCNAIEQVLNSPSSFDNPNFNCNNYFFKKNKKILKELRSEKNPYRKASDSMFDGSYSRWNFEHNREIYNVQQHINNLKQKIK